MYFSNISKFLLPLVCACGMFAACSHDGDSDDDIVGPGNNAAYSPVPDFDSAIEPFDPDIRATDSYTPGSDNDIYWQANNFKATVDIVYDGATATATSSSNKITVDVSGAHVAVDVTTDTKTEIRISGSSDCGSLKIYSLAKVLLVLDNVSLKSDIGPAVNSQSKKRLFVHATDNTVNSLADAEIYSDDKYYKQGASVDTEDRKGAFFSEDNTIISGKGLITIKGNNRHALATDGSLRVLPGTTLCVESSKKNAIHAKGSTKEFGVSIEGGYIYALCTGEAARCIKSDLDIRISKAVLSLNNSSSAAFDTEDNSTSSPAGIKTDTNINIERSEIYVKMTGDGAKGIYADLNVNLASSTVTVTSTGKRYVHDVDSSSPAGIKSGNIVGIASGEINVAMYGDDSKSDAIESKGSINVTGGNVYTYAYGNCLNAEQDVLISAGNVYAFSEQNEAIDAVSSIEISGGVTLSHSPVSLVSAAAPILNVRSGATIIAAGGNSMTNASSGSTTAVRFNDVNIAAGVPISVLGEPAVPLYSMVYLAPCANSPILIASPNFTQGTSWKFTTGGTISSTASQWHGFILGVVASSPKSSKSFTI